MFSELIYTRCRQGIDILKSGKSITSDGFKVYSCTPSLMEGGNTDLPFLFNAAQGKQPYNDPTFMDDAYLYFAPDKGDNFMVNFHPVTFDPNAKGDYSHRAGNFLNHILIGDFTEFYPFELFRDNAVWNAKLRGEAYYYENVPTALSVRSDVNDLVGQINLDELSSFISDGRKEALMTAVSFLISQYELPMEKRKFLVIRDVSSEMIELWIAAIECAFSPRMATAIPFSTRLDKFAMANRYTVNQLGVYQTQINLQDPNQKQRYRAMIVGVDERDKTNSAAARPLANSPFVLLDGKEKRAMFEADISHPYYRFITNFDDSHQVFCREFLQMLNIKQPSSDIYRLFDIYMALEETASLPNAEMLAKNLSVLDKYNVLASSRLKNLYSRIKDGLPQFLQEHLHSALQIIKWLQAVSKTVGDHNATQQLTGIVSKTFSEQVYRKQDSESVFGFWGEIKKTEFVSSVANYFVAPATYKINAAYLQQLNKSGKINFVLIYLECAAFADAVNIQDLKKSLVSYGFKMCSQENDINSAKKIMQALSQGKQDSAKDMLFSIIRETEKGHEEFFINLLIASDGSIVETDSSMLLFFKKLSAEKLEHLFASVLKCRMRKLARVTDIEQFLKVLKTIKPINNSDLVEIYETLDSKLAPTEKGSASVALMIQQERPQEAKCVNSAHIYAFEVLNDKHRRVPISDEYSQLAIQGFPSEKDRGYIKALIDRLIRMQMEQKELEYVIQMFVRVPEYITELVGAILDITTPKRNREWNILIAVATEMRSPIIFDIIVSECAKLKQGEKALAQLHDMLESGKVCNYFRKVAEKVTEIIRLRKSQSGLGKFLGMFKKEIDLPNDRGRK